MKSGTPLSDIDLFSPEHRVAPRRDAALSASRSKSRSVSSVMRFFE
jgi:hypothetical protein